MVEKLNLQCEKYPFPFHIACFKKENKVIIDKDEIWCDVILMDSCHMLLGRPWQYARKVMHDGEKNTYALWKDGSKVVFLPLKDEKKNETMFSIRKLLKEMKVICCFYVPILKRGEQQENVVPPEAKKMLVEFVDVAPKKLLDGILPKRDIRHHLDPILGENFLNQVAYQLNPTRHVESNKQVTELMHKGLVVESMSSCAVPTLLTPKRDVRWMMCIDSRVINKITIKYRFPIP